MVGDPTGDFAEHRDAAGDGLRIASGVHHSVHLESEFSGAWGAAADIGLGEHGEREPAGSGVRVVGADGAVDSDSDIDDIDQSDC